MRTLATARALGAVVVALGCADSGAILSPPASPHPVAANAQRSMVPRPLTGRCDVISTQVTGVTPPFVNQVGNAVCQLSHLGRVTVRNVQRVNVVTGAQTGEATWTAANGDLIYLTSLGTATSTGSTTFRFTGVATITGGTGRFVGAMGELNVDGSADNATGTGSFAYTSGWIIYSASNRAS